MSSPPPGVAPGPTSPPSPLAPPSPVVLLLPPPHPDNGTSPAVATTPPPGSSNSTTLVALGVGIGIGGALVLVCVGIFVIWYRRRKRKRLMADGFAYAPPPPQGPKGDPFRGPHYNPLQPAPSSTGNVFGLPKPTSPLDISSNYPSSSMDGATPTPPLFDSSMNTTNPMPQAAHGTSLASSKTAFTYDELARATDNFSSTNLLGQGGFGYVHKGVLCDGTEVAIKQLKVGSGQGEREFQAEVGTISRVHHRHLVSLVGHCSSGTQRLLVYEYVPNDTLEFHLHGKP